MIHALEYPSTAVVTGRSLDLIPEDTNDGVIRHTFLSEAEVAWEIVGGEMDGLHGVESCEVAVEDGRIVASWRERASGFAVFAVYDLARSCASMLLSSPAVHRVCECRLVSRDPSLDAAAFSS